MSPHTGCISDPVFDVVAITCKNKMEETCISQDYYWLMCIHILDSLQHSLCQTENCDVWNSGGTIHIMLSSGCPGYWEERNVLSPFIIKNVGLQISSNLGLELRNL